ncbi:MAG: 2OG-Fe dioxygenase family protein, partial [Burkholderiaceae bacterium]
MSLLLDPPLTPPESLASALEHAGHAALAPEALCRLAGVALAELDGWRDSWNDLPPDAYLRDGGHYRRRRHSCFVVDGDTLRDAPPRAHWQPVEYNALHGGLERWFEPMRPQLVGSSAWGRLLQAIGRAASELRGLQPWFVEAHQFRIDTEGGIGRPTPEGAHRDGVDLVAVLLVARV